MITTIIASVLGIVGVGGLGLIGLSAFGMGGPIVAGIVAFFVAKNIPWKLIAICAAAILIGLTIFSGFEIFKTNQANLEKTRIELVQEKAAHQQEKARADEYQVEHDAQVIRLQKLETDRASVEAETATLRQTIDDMTLEQDFTNDSAKAVATLNNRNVQLNKLLVDASRSTAGSNPAPVASHPVKAVGASPLQRAIRGLWQNGVPHAK